MMDLLKAVDEAATVVTGLSFISGWLYWSTYYSTFGLNALELDFLVAVYRCRRFRQPMHHASTIPAR